MSKKSKESKNNAEMFWNTLMSIIRNKKMNINQMYYLCKELGYFDGDNSILDEMLRFKFTKSSDIKQLNKLIVKNMKCLHELDDEWFSTISDFKVNTDPKEMVYKLLKLVFRDNKLLKSTPEIWKQFYYVDDDQKDGKKSDDDKLPIM